MRTLNKQVEQSHFQPTTIQKKKKGAAWWAVETLAQFVNKDANQTENEDSMCPRI